MKKSSVAVLILAAALAASIAAKADQEYHTIVSSEKIELFDSSGNALSYVTLDDGTKQDGTIYEASHKQNYDIGLTLYINNETAGDYIFSFLGTNPNCTPGYTVTITGVDSSNSSYSRTLTGTQPQTTPSGQWRIDDYGTGHYHFLDDLPAGNFSVYFDVNRPSGQTWAGHYGNFTFTSTKAYDMAGSNAKEANLSTGKSKEWLVLAAGTDSDSKIKISNGLIDSTHRGNTFTFTLFCDETADYAFSYRGGTHAATVTWTKDDEQLASDTFAAGGGSDPIDERTHSLGNVTAGTTITLKGTLGNVPQTWAGNYGHFVFYKAGTKLTADATASESISSRYVYDLNGWNLTWTTSMNKTAPIFFINTSDTTATLSVPGGTTCLTNQVLRGNIKYVISGRPTSPADFRKSTDLIDGAIVPNTHTGGTVLSGFNNEVSCYNITTNCGTGTIRFGGNANIKLKGGTSAGHIAGWNIISNNIEVSGTGNTLAFDPSNGDENRHHFYGAFTGDGALLFSPGWNPAISFYAASPDFEGTLTFAFGRADYGYRLESSSTGFPKGKVVLTNRSSGDDTPYPVLRFNQSAGDVYFGNLTSVYTSNSSIQEATVKSNTKLYAHTATSLHVGSLGVDGEFYGSFNEVGSAQFSLVKEGSGSWTLSSSNASTISGGITVSSGTLVLNTTISAGAVSVASGATLAGSGTIPSVSFESGAILSTTNLTVTGGSYFQTHNGVMSAAPYVYLDPDVLEARKTYTILTSTLMPGKALLHEDLTNQIAGVYLTQANNTLTLTVPANVVAPGRTAKNVSASSEEGALAAVAIKLTDDDIAAGRKTSYYKKVATETSSGFWSVEVKLADEVEVEIGADTTPSVTASTVTFSTPTNLKQGLYYGVASGNSVDSLTCKQNARYDGTPLPTLSANMPVSGVMYYSIEVSDTAKSSD